MEEINEKSTSREQQRLMGMAYAVRTGKLDRDKVRDDVLKLVDSDITDKQLKDFASTTYDEIDKEKEKKENIKNEVFKMKSLSSYISERLN